MTTANSVNAVTYVVCPVCKGSKVLPHGGVFVLCRRCNGSGYLLRVCDGGC